MNGREELLDTIELCIKQKQEVFLALKSYTEEQNQLLSSDELDLEAFESLIDKKELELQKLHEIDERLENTQNKYQHLLSSGLEPFTDQITRIHHQLEALGILVNSLNNLENANKDIIDGFFEDKKSDILSFRKSKVAASKYNQNMKDTHQDDTSYFMDKKK